MRSCSTFWNGWLSLLLSAACAGAQQQPPTVPDTPAANDAAPTVFRHPDSARYLVLGQANIIFQAHAPFHSPYEGANSLLGRGEYKTSLLGTLYFGYQLNRNPRFATDVILDAESSGGRGISQTLGLAGFTNLDVVRNPTLGSRPYLARYQLHQVIGLTNRLIDVQRTPYSLAVKLPARRLDLHVGRMGLSDFLDTNSVGSDSHLQFMNWTADNNGAWDYAANTRGYTDAFVAEYVDGPVSARYALAAMPTVANGTELVYNFHRANGQNLELELRQKALLNHKGVVRLLGYKNAANMGDYRTQNALALAAGTRPDITAHAQQTTNKYGFGVNVEQETSTNSRIYGRFGWNEGQHESFAYTEVDQTFAGGADYSMRRFNRPNDKAGITFISNAIKRDHQAYLALGGLGFLLGDGKLHYAREDIVESYYDLLVGHGVYYALDGQFIEHPGYNQARGPVLVESVRMHIDF
jgi:high affinity Mn2+ porin